MKEINNKSQIASFYVGVINNGKMLIASDKRCIIPIDGKYLVYDNTDKVYKLNENVILTVAGIFNDKELFIAPFLNGEIITNIDDSCDIIQEYLIGLQATNVAINSRSYLLGGYDKEGNLSIINVSYEDSDNTIYVDKQSGVDNGLMIMYLPDILLPEKESLENTLEKMLIDSKDRIDEAVISFINMIAEKSRLVDSNYSYIYLS